MAGGVKDIAPFSAIKRELTHLGTEYGGQASRLEPGRQGLVQKTGQEGIIA